MFWRVWCFSVQFEFQCVSSVLCALSRRCVVVCCVLCVAWCGGLNNRQIQNASVCTFKNVPVCTYATSACSNTCERVAGTRGDVLNVQTVALGMDTRQFVKVNASRVNRLTEVNDQSNHWILPIKSLIENNTFPIPPVIRFS